jgi:uncharacterized protein involved in tolerance to divalent cations
VFQTMRHAERWGGDVNTGLEIAVMLKTQKVKSQEALLTGLTAIEVVVHSAAL